MAGHKVGGVSVFGGEVASIFRRGLADFEELSGDEQIRLHMWFIAHTLNAQNVYMQFEDEIIHSDIAEAVLSFNASMLRLKGGAYWWSTVRTFLSPAFVADLDKRISKADLVTEA